MSYLIFTEKPEGNPEIGDGSFLDPVLCPEGWWVDAIHKAVCDKVGWKNYKELENITEVVQEQPQLNQ